MFCFFKITKCSFLPVPLFSTSRCGNFTSMNKIVRISTSLLLSLLILVSGSGLIIGKMVCLKSGYVQISANEAKDCCTDEELQTQFNDQCCAISNFSFQQQQFVGQDQLLLKSPGNFSLIALPEFLSFQTSSFHFPSQHHCFSNPPELLSGSSALPLLCVFRV